jgi:5-methylcytosine-specific restriction protein B
MLIESDKRGVELQLLYADEKFAVPENVYIIGMMNTADRSLAMLDYALRRRFAFYEMKPAFESMVSVHTEWNLITPNSTGLSLAWRTSTTQSLQMNHSAKASA